MSDRGFELDKRMRPIMGSHGNSFAAGTEVGVVTDGALVSDAANILLVWFTSAKGTVAVDADVHFFTRVDIWKLLKQLGKSVPRVVLCGGQDAARAIVPIGAGQAFVADTSDVLSTGLAFLARLKGPIYQNNGGCEFSARRT